MRSSGRKKWIGPVAALAGILLAIAVFLAVFYVPDENVEVQGSTRYPDERIRELAMPGFAQHNSLYLGFFQKILLTEDTPFIDSIECEYISRDHIRLHVNEDYPIGYIEQEGSRCYFDANGIVIEILAEAASSSDKATADSASSEASSDSTSSTATSDSTSSTETSAGEKAAGKEVDALTDEAVSDSTSATEDSAGEKAAGKEGDALTGEAASDSTLATEASAEKNAAGKEGDALTGEAASDSTSNAASEDTHFRPALTDVFLVTGLTQERVSLDQKIPVKNEHIFSMILAVNKLISKFEIAPDRIEVGEDGQSLTLHYGDVQIALGSDTLLEDKMSRAAAILPQLKGLRGILHLETFSEDTINIIFEKTEAKPTDSAEEDKANATIAIPDPAGDARKPESAQGQDGSEEAAPGEDDESAGEWNDEGENSESYDTDTYDSGNGETEYYDPEGDGYSDNGSGYYAPEEGGYDDYGSGEYTAEESGYDGDDSGYYASEESGYDDYGSEEYEDEEAG